MPECRIPGPPVTRQGAGQAEPLDLRGLKCPLPVLHTRRALARAAAGLRIDVRCTDPLAALDIPNLLRETGDTLVEVVRRGGEIRFLIRKQGGARATGQAAGDLSGSEDVDLAK